MSSFLSSTGYVLALLATNSLFAQEQPSQSSGGNGNAPATIPPPIYSSGGSSNTATTAVEGGARGAAAGVQAAGEYNYNTAAGLSAAADAESKGIANQSAALSNYFTLKSMNDDYQSRHRPQRINGQQASQISRNDAPRRLSAYQLDPTTGVITWPAILQRRRFGRYRQQLEALFADRESSNSGMGTTTYDRIINATEVFHEELRGHIDSMTPAEYVMAKRFLSSLGYEAQFVPVMDGAASSAN